MIYVAIIEDINEIREGISDMINSQTDMVCLLAFDSVEGFLNVLCDENVPDVILMDIGLPGMSGISGISIVKERFPEVNIIMFTIYHDSNKIFQSLRAGASGYLLKTTPFIEIKKAIEVVHKGGSFMSPQIARKVITFFQDNRQKAAPSGLTDKEKEIVLALADGLSYKMIANRQNISIETVRSHIKNIYKKLHVHSKAEVIKKSLSGEI